MAIARWSVGERKSGIPVDAWNAFADTAEAFAGQQNRVREFTDEEFNRPSITVDIENATGADLDELGVVMPDGSIFNLSDDDQVFRKRVSLRGISPVGGQQFLIAPAVIPAGGIRHAVLRGLSWANVDVVDALHTTAGAVTGDTVNLRSGVVGATILYKEKQGETPPDDLGVQKALLDITGRSAVGETIIVRLPSGTSIPARSGLTPGEKVAMEVWQNSGGVLEDTGSTKDIYNLSDLDIYANQADKYLLAHLDVDGFYYAQTPDVRMLDGYVADNLQGILHEESEQPEWIDTVTCTMGP